MSETLLIWLFVVMGSGIVGLYGLWYRHSRECEAQRIALATKITEMSGKLDRVIADIGDGDTGIRRSIHDLRGQVTPLAMWAQAEIEKQHRGRRG